jgi:hypothetical protein
MGVQSGHGSSPVQHLQMLWDRDQGLDVLPDRFSNMQVIRQMEMDIIMQSKKLFTPTIYQKYQKSLFYVIYHVRGAHSDDCWFMKPISVSTTIVRKGPVEYFRCKLSTNVSIGYEPFMNYDDDDDVTHCFFLLYLEVNGYLSGEDDDDYEINNKQEEAISLEVVWQQSSTSNTIKYSMDTIVCCQLCGASNNMKIVGTLMILLEVL